jgi:penicillin-binding protein 1A
MRIMLGLLVLGLTGLIFGCIALFFILHYYSQGLPDYTQLDKYEPPHVTRLYTADGRILEEYAKEKRVFVPISHIPKRLQQAFIAAEDQNFYHHPGIDITAIVRAAATNFSSGGGSLVGGSTITQQVVKNFLLTREQSMERKIREAILAFRITKAFSKDKILELYLNEIYLGFGTYGVAAAALNYFNKSIDELDIEEAAFLAALPKAPAHYDPRRNYQRVKDRRDWVVSRMREDGYITAEESLKARQAPIVLRQRDETEFVVAPNFAEEVRREIAKRYGEDTLYKGGLAIHTTLDPKFQRYAEIALLDAIMMYEERHGYKGPLKVMEAVSDWQRELSAIPKPAGAGRWKLAVVLKVEPAKAQIGLDDGTRGSILVGDTGWARPRVDNMPVGEGISRMGQVVSPGDVILVEAKPAPDGNALKEALYLLRQVPDADGGMMVMDPHTGRVLAMVGGTGFRNRDFNRATQARRQPGSAFKPFVYLSGLENGLSPSSIIVDGPVSLYQGAGLPLWTPKNYSNDYLGPTTLRIGVEKSRNAMTVRLAQMLGIDRVLELGKRFGIYDERTPRNFSIILGSAETKLVNMAGAYAMLVNGGKRVTPTMVERIQDRHGKLVFRADQRDCGGCQTPIVNPSAEDVKKDEPPAILPEPSAEVPVIPDAREEVIDPLTAYQMVSILEGVVQRGTAQRAKVLGLSMGGKTGTTNDSRDVWFMGFTPDLVVGTYIGFDQPRSLGAKETGGSTALPAFIRFFEQAKADIQPKPFRIPPGIHLIKVNHDTGRYPGAGTPPGKIIFEAFKPGTSPDQRGYLHFNKPENMVNTQPYSSGGGGGYHAPSYEPSAPVDPYDIPSTVNAAPEVPSTMGTGGLY